MPLIPLKLKLYVVVSHQIRVLRTKLQSIAEGPSAFNTEPSLQDLDFVQSIFPKMVML